MPRFKPSILIADCWGSVGYLTFYHVDGKGASSHKPPFDGTSHINGQNLFVSAFQSFYTLGNEHTPEPQPFAEFPIDALEFVSRDRPNSNDLLLRFHLTFEDCPPPERYHLLLKFQLTNPGHGKKPGKMRNFLALAPCSAGNSTVEILVKNYRNIWGLDLPE